MVESHLSAGLNVIALSAAIHARTAPAATSQEATTWPRADLVRDFGLLTMNQVVMARRDFPDHVVARIPI